MTNSLLEAFRADRPSLDRAATRMIGRAEVSADEGNSWRVVTEFTARRKQA